VKKSTRFFAFLLLSIFFLNDPGFAAWVWSPESGKFINPDQEVEGTPQEVYDRAMESYQKKDLKETIEKLRLLLKKYPSAKISAEAQYRLGTVYEEIGDFYKAFRAYQDLVQRYPQSEQMAEALKREFQIGNLFLSGRKAKLMGLEILPSAPRAIEVFKHLTEAAPYSEYGDQAQFHLGLAYKKANRFDEAKVAFQTLVDNYPESPLVPQARFQIADTSYVHSVTANRDQRVIDQAETDIDRFLREYPDSSVSDKAAKLRQEIDEKNAEKNYRIARFYEKENYLDSAFIYYRDVAARYPHTSWGSKAKDRISALERPAEFLKAQEAEVAAKKEKVLSEIQSLGSSDEAKKRDLEFELERLEKEEKEVRKSKPETLKRRRAALEQKEKELKEKWKALGQKRKKFSKNPSEDLALAFERWEASLQKEKADLLREKFLIKEWEKSLGVRTTSRLASLVPFGKEGPSPLEQVQEVEADRLEKLLRERKELLWEKEGLYREYEKVLSTEGIVEAGDRVYETRREKLDRQAEEIEALRGKLKAKEELYKKEFGISPLEAAWEVPKAVVDRSVDLLIPFEGNPDKDWQSKSPQELESLRLQWKERIANQKEIVETISRSFGDELARAEERSLAADLQRTDVDPSTLKRAVKHLEREIRSHYNEIQDRNKRKNELIEDLDQIIKGREQGEGLAQTGQAVTAPVRGAFYLGKAFLFGLPEKDIEVTEKARGLSSEGDRSEEIRALREAIELESLLIEARNEELRKLERDVEALRAQASLAGGPKFRSLVVKFPYVFIKEAVASANRIVPKKDRKERLIEQLNKETKRLESFKKELGEIEETLQEKKGMPSVSEKTEAAPAPEPVRESKKPDEADRALLREEIRTLSKTLDLKREAYEHEKGGFEKTRWDKISKSQGKVRPAKLRAIEGGLVRVIERERKLHEEEKGLLAKKMAVVEELLTELPRDLFEKDLQLKKQEIESRLNEIQKREMNLGEELERFRPQASPRVR
jgi:outer membrane protein assembly factor BamD